MILGSFPSVKSRETEFFYGHPQNRFWRVLAFVLEKDIPITIEEKKALMLRSHIALWDVIASCDITGSSDSSIKNAAVNDITKILHNSQINKIYVNGNTAARLYKMHMYPVTGIEAVCLPSTSPANAAWSFERLCDAWKTISDNL